MDPCAASRADTGTNTTALHLCTDRRRVVVIILHHLHAYYTPTTRMKQNNSRSPTICLTREVSSTRAYSDLCATMCRASPSARHVLITLTCIDDTKQASFYDTLWSPHCVMTDPLVADDVGTITTRLHDSNLARLWVARMFSQPFLMNSCVSVVDAIIL